MGSVRCGAGHVDRLSALLSQQLSKSYRTILRREGVKDERGRMRQAFEEVAQMQVPERGCAERAAAPLPLINVLSHIVQLGQLGIFASSSLVQLSKEVLADTGI